MRQQYFTFDGKSSRDFAVWINGGGTFGSPARDITSVQIPGRNGDLTIDNGRFLNTDISYQAYISEDFRRNFDAFKAWMESRSGYKRLADSYHPEYFRRARLKESIQPNMGAFNKFGTFEVIFDCDPRKFLKEGEKKREYTASGSLKNPTRFEALPLMRVYGTGTVTIGSVAVTINTANVYTDIDCELQEAYKGSTNCNGNITLGSGEFPKLKEGTNNIYLSGVSKVELTPRWWTI